MEEFLSSLGRSPARAYREDLADFSRWFFESNDQELKPGLVSILDLRDYLSQLLTVRGLKASTVNRRIAAIHAWLEWAKEKGVIADLPSFPRRLREPKRAPKSLQKVEEMRFSRSVSREGNPRDCAAIRLMRYAGLQVSEAVSIRP